MGIKEKEGGVILDELTVVRQIRYEELNELLLLYKHLNKDDPELIYDDKLKSHWDEIYNDPNMYYIVNGDDL